MVRGEERSRNLTPWIWGGVGCCAGCIVIPVVLVAVLGGGVVYLFRSSGIQEEVLGRVRADPEAVAALGEPIEAGWLIQGSIHLSDDGGEADFSLPVSGPDGSGRVYVVAQRRAGEWRFEELVLRVEGGATIDLLAARTAWAPVPGPTDC